MNNELLENAFLKLNEKEKNIIKTNFDKLDEALSYCGFGSVITFAGTLNSELFLNLLVSFFNQNKKCLYFIENYKREIFVKNLMLLASTFENNDLQKTKEKMKNWNLEFYDKKLQNIQELKKIIEKEKPDYIFIDNIRKFKIKEMPSDYQANHIDYISKYLKIYSAKYSAISFIKTGISMMEGVDIDWINYDELRKVSEVVIASIFDNHSMDNCSFWILKNNITDVGEFTLKYEYKKFRFIHVPDII